MTTFPFSPAELTSVPLKLSPALLVLELSSLEIRAEKDVPAGRIRGAGGGGGGTGAAATATGAGAGCGSSGAGAAVLGVIDGAGTGAVAEAD